MSKRENLIKCNGCSTIFSFEFSDIDEVTYGMRYRTFCPECKSENRIAIGVYNAERTKHDKLNPSTEEEAPNTASTPEANPVSDVMAEKRQQAEDLAKAITALGSIKNAAKSLKMTIPAAKKLLEHLPSQEAAVGEV